MSKLTVKLRYIQISQIKEKYNSLAKNHCNRKKSFVINFDTIKFICDKKSFLAPPTKNHGYGSGLEFFFL
jgi:hypothetical protein